MTDPNLAAHPRFGNAVGATTVTPLRARAHGAELFNVTDWHDEQAQQAWERLERLGEAEGFDPVELCLLDESNTVGTIRRSQSFDLQVREFVESHKRSQVVSLGIGLCNRAHRLAHLDTSWIGVDHPDVLAVRRTLIPDDVTTLIDGDLTRREWLGQIDPAVPTIIAVEGVFMYLPEQAITQLLVRVADHFSADTRLVADAQYHLFARATQPITRRTGAEYQFGFRSFRHFASLAPGWRLHAADDMMSRMGPAAARASRVFRFFSRGRVYPYSVVTLEKDNRASS